MDNTYARFLGVDLGGGRGKTTAVAELRTARSGGVEVIQVATRAGDRLWTDDTLIERLGTARDVIIAIDAPLTQTACGRCERPVCPGMETCVDPAVAWLREEGRALLARGTQIARQGGSLTSISRSAPSPQARLAPYAHRATDVVMTYQRGLLPVTSLGAPHGAVAARANQLRRRLRGAGFELHRSLIEVSPAATIAALCGAIAARGYKRDADPWRTRATILEQLGDLTFAPQSRMAREEVLQNDHCFDAVIAGYTAYRFARDGWKLPDGVFADDGWVFAPTP